ncbi:MAG: 4'-phosphopantetheinyl transferase superfamily protein, partial [Syntrophobacterales bacterium]|nr:4'-phosphopantetheinyl transferase superfamily protein [Syntrophobacterales bacterium]
MVGNDIVDLTDSRTKEKSRDMRFMNRVFTPDEQRNILKSSNPDIVLWSLWAAKETGYKAISKLHPAVSSAPRHYEVKLFSANGSLPETGIVHTPCGPVSVCFFISSDHIHCIGTTPGKDTDSIMWDVRKIYQRQFSPDYESNLVRNMAGEKIARYLKEDSKAIEIIRPKGHRGLGPPVIYAGKKRSTIDISMSHDGLFVAYAL